MPSAVIICPGRGTYNAAELGYLSRNFPDPSLLARFDALRQKAGQETLTSLDSAQRFSLSRHGRGDNASGLIFASSLGDFAAIDRGTINIVAVTGNSMGWYSALSCGEALTPETGFQVANTMGTLMQEAMIGGQLVYSWMDDQWRADFARKEELLLLVDAIASRPDTELFLSIDLGGMLVLAGNEAGLKAFEGSVEPIGDRFPKRLGNHAAFHTPLQAPVAAAGRERLMAGTWQQPALPLIDGTGRIWWPGSSNLDAMHDYTLGEQIVAKYDFSAALKVAAREFAPDLFIVLGPGTTLGGAVAQSLVLASWRGMSDKQQFQNLQKQSPLLVAMGNEAQRSQVIRR